MQSCDVVPGVAEGTVAVVAKQSSDPPRGVTVVNVKWPSFLLAAAGGTSAILVCKHLVELLGSKSVAREYAGAAFVRAHLGVLPLVRDRLSVPFGTRVL